MKKQVELEELARDFNFRRKEFVDLIGRVSRETAREIEWLIRGGFRGDSLKPGKILALIVRLCQEIRRGY